VLLRSDISAVWVKHNLMTKDLMKPTHYRPSVALIDSSHGTSPARLCNNLYYSLVFTVKADQLLGKSRFLGGLAAFIYNIFTAGWRLQPQFSRPAVGLFRPLNRGQCSQLSRQLLGLYASLRSSFLTATAKIAAKNVPHLLKLSLK